MNVKANRYHIRTTLGASGVTITIPFNATFFGFAAQKFLVIESLVWCASYDLTASPGVFTHTPGIIILGGVGSKAYMLKSGQDMSSTNVQYPDRVFHLNMQLLVGVITPASDSIQLTPNYWPGVAAASINSFQGQAIMAWDFYDPKIAKQIFDV